MTQDRMSRKERHFHADQIHRESPNRFQVVMRIDTRDRAEEILPSPAILVADYPLG